MREVENKNIILSKLLLISFVMTLVGSLFIYSCDFYEGIRGFGGYGIPVNSTEKLGVREDHNRGFNNLTGEPAGSGVTPPSLELPDGDPDFSWHRPGLFRPYANNCTVCHGADLAGGTPWTDEDGKTTTPPSCTVCHGVIWTETTPSTAPEFFAPADHTVANRGRMHKPAVINNPFFFNNNAVNASGSSACTVCHGDGTGTFLDGGADYAGTAPPACSVCHGPRWTADISVPPPVFNPPVDHATNMRDRLHKTDVDINQAYDNCSECHGRTLAGEAVLGAPSCFACHDQRWTQVFTGRPRTNSPPDHTSNSLRRMHKPGRIKPFYVNRASSGPGSDVPTYDPEAGGTSGACFVCHGDDLKGGILENGKKPPSCYTCHSQLWQTIPDNRGITFNPPPSHLEVKRGRIHRPGHSNPSVGLPDFEGNDNFGMCIACHGDTLTGGVAWTNGAGLTATPPSCYTCHNVRWTGAIVPVTFNPPPSHDPVNGGDNVRGHFHRSGHDNPADGLPNFEGNGNFGMCVVCHGADLQGGVPWTNRAGATTKPPSCYTCHVQRWTGDLNPIVFDPTSDHIVSRRGRMHRPLPGDVNAANPLNPWLGSPRPGFFPDAGYGYCAVCHSNNNANTNLQGGPINPITGKKPPSCYTCHVQRWDGSATGNLSANFCTGGGGGGGMGGGMMCAVGHVVNMRGRLHKTDYLNPTTCRTVACHGAVLRGSGGRPSCYSCHGQEWN